MPRIVKRGQPGNLYRLKRGDLPRDKDMRQSFLIFVDLSCFDLSDYDLRDADIISCDATNVTLGEHEWMMSRFTDWTGANLPPNIDPFNWDLLKEHFTQYSPSNVAETQLIAKAMAVAQDGSYTHSWRNVLKAEETELGMTRAEVRAINANIFAGNPTCLRRLDQQYATNDIGDSLAIERPTFYDAWRVRHSDERESLVDLRNKIPLTMDRYQAARDLSSSLEAELREPYLVWMWFLHPFAIPIIYPLRLAENLPFGWWGKFLGF